MNINTPSRNLIEELSKTSLLNFHSTRSFIIQGTAKKCTETTGIKIWDGKSGI